MINHEKNWKKNALIFGSTGQDGFYLRNLLTKNKINVIGISRSQEDLGTILGDVSDKELVTSLIKTYKPDFIFHFAAKSTVSHDMLLENHNAICLGGINILEAARAYIPNAKIFFTGSAIQFLNNGGAIDEKTPFEPSSPYSVSRIHAVYLARYYRSAFKMKVYMGYLFHHDSPLRGESHINQKIVMEAHKIKDGVQDKLFIQNLNFEKEFTFAGDIVKAIWILVNQDQVFEAVIGSGVTHKLSEWVELCFKKVDLNPSKYIISSESQPLDIKKVVSNPAIIKSLGWSPEVSICTLADMMMEKKLK